jgi:hypothetical protein
MEEKNWNVTIEKFDGQSITLECDDSQAQLWLGAALQSSRSDVVKTAVRRIIVERKA